MWNRSFRRGNVKINKLWTIVNQGFILCLDDNEPANVFGFPLIDWLLCKIWPTSSSHVSLFVVRNFFLPNFDRVVIVNAMMTYVITRWKLKPKDLKWRFKMKYSFAVTVVNICYAWGWEKFKKKYIENWNM